MRTTLAVAVALAVGGVPVITLPHPTFPAPVESAPAARHLQVVASRYRHPGLLPPERPGRGAPDRLGGRPLVDTIRQPGTTFALHGPDPASAHLLLVLDSRTLGPRYALHFRAYARPPRIAPGERQFVFERIVWAREKDGVLYVEHAHPTYARSSYGRNAYVTAIDLDRKRVLWRSPALVANAGTFVLVGPYLVTGYGFTAEPDYLYLLDRRSGRVVERLLLPTAPARIALRGDRLHVRAYDHDVVVRIVRD